jgi:hypothetical protein
MKFITSLLLFIGTVFASNSSESCNLITPSNNCVNFQVSPGTGCAWMCSYCASSLGTNNYYFTNGVCTYQEGVGCVGNPQTGVTYTCCSA